MARTTFSGREVIEVLTSFGWHVTSAKGSHRRLKYENPDTGEIRIVDVPMHDEIAIGTLHDIADACGAKDFHRWCRWIDDHR